MHIFGSCSLSPSTYKQRCNWMRQWVTRISIQSQRISVSVHPSLLPHRPSHLRHNGNDCKLLSSSEFHLGGGSGSGGGDCSRRWWDACWLLWSTAGHDTDEFNLYVDVDADVQTAAEVTDEKLCAGQQAAGDVDTDGERSSEARRREADDNRQQPSQDTLSNALLCLDTECAYMEMADYDSYERLYGRAGDCYWYLIVQIARLRSSAVVFFMNLRNKSDKIRNCVERLWNLLLLCFAASMVRRHFSLLRGLSVPILRRSLHHIKR